MEKKSKRKNDLRSSIILLLILLLLLITSTYAWFTANTVVKVSSIDVNIEAKNGLQISTDAEHWKTIISNEDIIKGYTNGQTDTNQLPSGMEPVSTIGTYVEDGTMEMFYGEVKANGDTGEYQITTPVKEAESKSPAAEPGKRGTDKKYVAFDIFLKVDKSTKIKLGEQSGVVDKGENGDRGIKQASRIAFCEHGNLPSGTSPDELTVLKKGGKAIIWEPNCNLHTAAAKEHANSTYGDSTVTTDGLDEAIPYYGIKAQIDAAQPLNSQETQYFEQVKPQFSTKATPEGVLQAEAPVNIFTLQPGITKFRVYMWVEGQDYDCENTASGADIGYTVQLAVDDSGAGA